MNFLRKLFGPPRPTIDSVQFDRPDGWPLQEQSAQRRSWAHPETELQLSLNFFALPPDLPAGLSPDALRRQYRRMLAAQSAGLIEVSVHQQAGTPVVYTLFKFALEPSGLGYLGSLTLPFRDCSYVLKVQASEQGLTGMREAVVAEQLMQTGALQLTEQGFTDWFADPYDPYYTVGTLMSRAERPEYDAEWPEHPLTLVRQQLAALQASLRLAPELRQAAPFA